MRTHLLMVWATVRSCIAEWRAHPDAGYTTETVLVTALLVIVALAVLAIIAAKLVSKTNGINLG